MRRIALIGILFLLLLFAGCGQQNQLGGANDIDLVIPSRPEVSRNSNTNTVTQPIQTPEIPPIEEISVEAPPPEEALEAPPVEEMTTEASPPEEIREIDPYDISNYISVVLIGIESHNLYDFAGIRLIRQYHWLYRQLPDGAVQRVGHVHRLNLEEGHFQYVLDAREFVFRNMTFSDSMEASIRVFSFENWENTAWVSYSDFPTSNYLELLVSPNFAQLSDAQSHSIIEPSFVASPEQLF